MADEARATAPAATATEAAAADTITATAVVPHQLMFPGKLVDGIREPAPLVLEGQTAKTLSAWCKEYGLPHSGKKDVLKARLTAFSEDRERWDGTVPGATRKHRNASSTTTTATTASAAATTTTAYKRPPKQSARRREAMFGINDALCGHDEESVPHALPAEASVDTRTDEEALRHLEWAENFMKTHPYPVPPPPGAPSKPRAPPVGPAACAPLLGATAAAALQASVDENTSCLQQLITRVSALEPAMSRSSPSQLPPTQLQASPVGPRASSPLSSGPTSRASSPAPSAPPSYRTLVFADGSRLRFTESQVPDPPAATFSDNIPRLNAIWDGPAKHPAEESPLVINGKRIPLVYWPQVYKYWKKDQWKGTKGKWFEWKVIVNRWRQASPANFWAEFSVEGKYLSYTNIIARLSEQREVEDAALADLARSEYGPAFAEKFMYRRGSCWFVMQKPSIIAKHYRALKGLPPPGQQ